MLCLYGIGARIYTWGARSVMACILLQLLVTVYSGVALCALHMNIFVLSVVYACVCVSVRLLVKNSRNLRNTKDAKKLSFICEITQNGINAASRMKVQCTKVNQTLLSCYQSAENDNTIEFQSKFDIFKEATFFGQKCPIPTEIRWCCHFLLVEVESKA